MPARPAPAPSVRSTPVTTAARLPHLDALRGGALLLGVLLHALMPYLPGRLWLVSDTSESGFAAAAVGVIHLFRMMLFMMLAGYFGHIVLHRRGPGPYVRDRLVRIALPLVVFWPLLFALMIFAMEVNIAAGAVPPPATGAPLEGPLALPTMHLWFLLLLMEIVLVVVIVRAILRRVLGSQRAQRFSVRLGALLSSRRALLIVALPYATGLLIQPGGVTSLTEPYTLVPVAGASIGYTGAFLTGWFPRAAPGALERVERGWPSHLALAVVLGPLGLLAPSAVPTPVVAGLAALSGWAWVLGLTGLCARLVRREIPWVRYLADSSYWVYLMHFPLLLLAAVPLSQLGLPAGVELVIALGAVMAVLLLSYDLCVRPTWIGAWLNGRRRPRGLRRRRPRPVPAGAPPER